jgi:hypothetical protein
MTEGDPFAANAANAESLSGYQDVLIHGGPDVMASAPEGPLLDPADVAAQVLEDSSYGGGPVRLLSCSVACGSAAQAFTNALGQSVMAYTNTLYAAPDGTLFGAGEWQAFEPGGG